jgi:hypothetical protein
MPLYSHILDKLQDHHWPNFSIRAEEDKQNQEGKRREEEWSVSISLLNAVIQLAIIS